MKTIRVRSRNSIWGKSIGLLGYKKVQPIFFQTRFGIHTFGMRVPIDVLILDKNKGIVRLIENLKPNRLFFWPPRYNNVIELPEGTIRKLKIRDGGKIKLEFIR